MTKLTTTHLQEIRDRCEKATPGPWVTDSEESIKVRAPHGGYVSMIGWLKGKHGEKGRIAADEGADNAHFIAAARSDIPALLDHIAAQDAEIDRLRPEYHKLLLAHLRVMKRDGDLYDASGFGSSAEIMMKLADEGLFEITVNAPDNRIMGRLTEAGVKAMGGGE